MGASSRMRLMFPDLNNWVSGSSRLEMETITREQICAWVGRGVAKTRTPV